MKRIALINQRYGEDVVGGSEAYTRSIAERLCNDFEVEVLTTCALDYMTWDNHYPEGAETLNGVTIRRFPVDRPREVEKFSRLCKILQHPDTVSEAQQRNWVDEQGPYCPKLIQYLRDHRNDYDVFIFVTYLYYLTYYGIKEVADKAVLIPTAHDEPPIHMSTYRDVFLLPRALVFLTEEEQSFVHKTFRNENIPYDILGAGVSVPSLDTVSDRAKALESDEMIVYVGRIEPMAKGCQALFDYFTHYKKTHGGNLKLVLMGKAHMEIPDRPDIIPLGFVSEEDKFFIVERAKALILPSPYESLSIAVLEAFSMETPVIVNGRCEVLKAHCIKSNAGLFYTHYFEFEGCLSYLLKNEPVRLAMGKNGKAYVDQNYTWESIMSRLKKLLEKVSGDGQ